MHMLAVHVINGINATVFITSLYFSLFTLLNSFVSSQYKPLLDDTRILAFDDDTLTFERPHEILRISIYTATPFSPPWKRKQRALKVSSSPGRQNRYAPPSPKCLPAESHVDQQLIAQTVIRTICVRWDLEVYRI